MGFDHGGRASPVEQPLRIANRLREAESDAEVVSVCVDRSRNPACRKDILDLAGFVGCALLPTIALSYQSW